MAQQKLYTEEQVRKAMADSYIIGTDREDNCLEIEEYIRKNLTPIELPSDEEIEIKSQIIELEYHGMQYTNFNQGLKKGAELMANWMKEQILNQNK